MTNELCGVFLREDNTALRLCASLNASHSFPLTSTVDVVAWTVEEVSRETFRLTRGGHVCADDYLLVCIALTTALLVLILCVVGALCIRIACLKLHTAEKEWVRVPVDDG